MATALTSSGADTITISLVGFVIVIAIVVVWRVAIHDRSIRRVRFGVFYERERDHDDEEPHDRPDDRVA